MNYKIRSTEPKDIAEIIALCAEHATYEKALYNAEGKAEKMQQLLFGQNARLQCLVVEHEKDILGYATFCLECSTWDAQYYTHMDCLYLRDSYRGQGIGEALINCIKEKSIELGAHHIEWQTPSFNERAIKFYRRLGATSKEKLRFYIHF
jgi:GNAT superfamily N-acetyltransferase